MGRGEGVEQFRKYGITFQDAVKAFDDPNGIELRDDRNSEAETRFHLVAVARDVLLLVAFTERNDRIRIISARRASAIHKNIYYERET